MLHGNGEIVVDTFVMRLYHERQNQSCSHYEHMANGFLDSLQRTALAMFDAAVAMIRLANHLLSVQQERVLALTFLAG